MWVLISLVACWGDEGAPTPPATVDVLPLAPEDGPLPEPRRGVIEVVTPTDILRPTEVQDRAAPVLLDIHFDPDTTTFDALGVKLESWGFSLLDGDGESWRVGAPAGSSWAARLVPLAEVLRVTEAVDLRAFETGAFREGSERYGAYVHTWAWREGGPVQVFSGGPTPPDPMLPRALPPSIVRCLAPARTDLGMGVSVGIGWERALVVRPPTWVLVFEEYGACKATGYLRLRPDAAVDTLTIGGRPLAQVDDSHLHALAIDVLRSERSAEDVTGIAAWDLLRHAPVETLVRAVAEIAPGPFQERIWEELDSRDHAAALTAAAASTRLKAKAAAEDETLRGEALRDPAASTAAQFAALTAWRPSPNDPPGILERLRSSPSPRVREQAWELTLDATMAACLARMKGIATANALVAAAIYRECPQQPVRSPAFQRVAALDPVAAGAMVRVVLEEPETTRTGIAAVRNAAALERNDLLEATVRRRTVSREARRLALDFLHRTSAPGVEEIAEEHGNYLGFKPAGAPVPAGAASPVRGGSSAAESP